MTRRPHIYTSMAWRIALDFFSRGIFFVVHIVVARRLGVADFGRVGYITSFVQIFYTFTDLGLHIQMIKELGEARDHAQEKWKDFFDLKLVLMAITCAAFLIATFVFARHENPILLFMAFLWMCSNSLLDFNQFVCNGLGRMDLAKNSMLFQRLILVAVSLVCLFVAPTVPSVIFGFMTGGVIGGIISNHYLLRVLGMKFSFDRNWGEWKSMMMRAIPNGIGATFGQWYLRLGAVLLARVWTDHTVGAYTGAFRIFEITYIVPGALMTVSVPHLADALMSGRDLFKRELRRICLAMGAAGLAWAGLLYFGRTIIVQRLLGVSFMEAVPVLRVLALVAFLVFANYVVTHLMVVFNAQHRHAVHEFVVFILSLVLYHFLIPTHGAVGAAAALLGTEVALFALTTGYLLFRRDLVRSSV